MAEAAFDRLDWLTELVRSKKEWSYADQIPETEPGITPAPYILGIVQILNDLRAKMMDRFYSTGLISPVRDA